MFVVKRDHSAPMDHADNDAVIIITYYRKTVDVLYSEFLENGIQIIRRERHEDSGTVREFQSGCQKRTKTRIDPSDWAFATPGPAGGQSNGRNNGFDHGNTAPDKPLLLW